ncbi:hypothetical protein Bcav_0798 [Beutenbergia cavernae DSM 12333]|uniref:Uncharacterized protein n=2 Tax=Beutenbergia TaxID=84756 RepID=C5BYV1_BEUC1|nr:hypothetical protein Bcav_0798 [Beutenbergia cavernae DSM 12333]
MLPAAVVVLVLPALAAVSGGLVQLRACVPGDGVTGWLGAHLALLRPDPACPDGTLAPHAGTMLAVVGTLALPALLAHLGLLVALASFGRLLVAGARVVAALVAGFVARIPTVVPVGRVRRVRYWCARVVQAVTRPAADLAAGRGPPALAG